MLIDADPQGSLSQGFFGSTTIENLPAAQTLAALFADDLIPHSLDSLIVDTSFSGITMVRTNQWLAAFNQPEPEKCGMLQFVISEFLRTISNVDVVIIDCPPNLYLCSWSAMLASDYVLIPVPPEDFGTQGLRVVHQAIENAKVLNPKLQLLGHIVTRVDQRLLVHRSYEEKLRLLYGDMVLTTVIPESSAYKVALACRMPVTQYSPRAKAARIMAALGNEIFDRTESSTEALRRA